MVFLFASKTTLQSGSTAAKTNAGAWWMNEESTVTRDAPAMMKNPRPTANTRKTVTCLLLFLCIRSFSAWDSHSNRRSVIFESIARAMSMAPWQTFVNGEVSTSRSHAGVRRSMGGMLARYMRAKSALYRSSNACTRSGFSDFTIRPAW